MVVSLHTYTAVLKGTPDVALEVVGGSITLDATRAPHVTGNITITGASLATLNALDPRMNRRIEVTCTRTNPSQTRTFNLGLRRRGIPQEDLTVVLELASDEALLLDYLALADDDTTFGLADSLRDVIDYVLDTAIPGAALAASPSTDVDVHPTWEVTNLHTNPEIVNTYGYGLGVGATAVTRVLFGSVPAIRWTASMSDSVLVPTAGMDYFRVRPGAWYTFTIELLSAVAPRLAQLGIQWYTGDGTAPMQTLYGASQSTNMATWTTYTITARAPVGAASLVPLVFTYGNVPGEDQFAKRVMVYEGDRVVTSFSGGYTTDADYDYEWTASADGSPSIRKPLNDTPDLGALAWEAGQSALDFLLPLVQAQGLRLVCDEARTWTLRNDAYTAAGSLTVTYGTNMVGGEDSLNRSNDAWFNAATTVYAWTDRNGIPQRMVDSYSSGSQVKGKLYQKDTPYPGAGFSQYAVERAANRGREISVTTVADWNANSDQAITVTPWVTGVETGKTQSVTFDLDRDEMTVTTRTD